MNPNVQLGLSYHVIDGGFAHYAVFEVSEEQEIPGGMLEIRVPEWTYVKTTHNKGEGIDKTYSDLHQWFFDNKITPLREAGVEYYDDMPIKHEHYPVDRDRNDEHYEIYIPIQTDYSKI